LQHKLVKEAAVIVRENDETGKYVNAYVAIDKNLEGEGLKTVREYLRNKLPQYMQPSNIIEVSEIPLTLNGKVNKEALIKNDEEYFTESCEEPTNETEEKLLAIWQNVLNTKNISLEDNFFEIGGNSLLLISMYEKIKESITNDIEIADIFANPSIYILAEFIQNQNQKIL
jgi:hypothetical protein